MPSSKVTPISYFAVPPDAKTACFIVQAAALAAGAQEKESLATRYIVPKVCALPAIILSTFNIGLYFVRGLSEFVTRITELKPAEAAKALGKHLLNSARCAFIVVALAITFVISFVFPSIFKYWIQAEDSIETKLKTEKDKQTILELQAKVSKQTDKIAELEKDVKTRAPEGDEKRSNELGTLRKSLEEARGDLTRLTTERDRLQAELKVSNEARTKAEAENRQIQLNPQFNQQFNAFTAFIASGAVAQEEALKTARAQASDAKAAMERAQEAEVVAKRAFAESEAKLSHALQKVKELEGTVARLETENASLKGRVTDLGQQNEDLANKLKISTGEAVSRLSEIGRLKAEVEGKKHTITEMEEAAKKASIAFAESEAKLSAAHETLKAQEDTIAQLQKERALLADQVSILKKEKEELNTQLLGSTVESTSQHLEIERLRGELEKRDKRIAELEKERAELLEQANNLLIEVGKAEAATAQVGKLQEELDETLQKLAGLEKTTLPDLQQQIEGRDEELRKLREELKLKLEIEKLLAAERAKTEEFGTRIKELEEGLKQRTAALDEATRLKDEASKEIESLKAEIADLRQKLSEAESKIKEFESELERMRLQNSELRGQLEAANAKAAESEQLIKEKDETIQKLKEDITRATTEYANIQRKFSDSQRAFEGKLKEKDDAFSKADLEHQQTVFELTQQASNALEARRLLKEQLRDASTEKAQLLEELGEVKASVALLQEQIGEKDRKFQTLEAEVKKVAEEHAQVAERDRLKIASLEKRVSEIETLKKNKAELEQSALTLTKRASEAENRSKLLRNENEELRKKIAQQAKDLEFAEQRNKSLQNRLERLNKTIEDLRATNKLLQENVADLTEENAQHKKEIDSLTKQKNEASERANETQKLLVIEKGKFSEAQKALLEAAKREELANKNAEEFQRQVGVLQGQHDSHLIVLESIKNSAITALGSGVTPPATAQEGAVLLSEAHLKEKEMNEKLRQEIKLLRKEKEEALEKARKDQVELVFIEHGKVEKAEQARRAAEEKAGIDRKAAEELAAKIGVVEGERDAAVRKLQQELLASKEHVVRALGAEVAVPDTSQGCAAILGEANEKLHERIEELETERSTTEKQRGRQLKVMEDQLEGFKRLNKLNIKEKDQAHSDLQKLNRRINSMNLAYFKTATIRGPEAAVSQREIKEKNEKTTKTVSFDIPTPTVETEQSRHEKLHAELVGKIEASLDNMENQLREEGLRKLTTGTTITTTPAKTTPVTTMTSTTSVPAKTSSSSSSSTTSPSPAKTTPTTIPHSATKVATPTKKHPGTPLKSSLKKPIAPVPVVSADTTATTATTTPPTATATPPAKAEATAAATTTTTT